MQIIVDIFLFIVYFILFLMIIAWTWRFWLLFVSQKFMNTMNGNFILLEIKLPREIFKSPEATEIAINAFLQSGGVANWYKRNWVGAVVTFFSLEIASIEGEVKFFVRCEKKFKELVTNNFYSQYPGIQIFESEDYVTKIFYDHRHDNVKFWSAASRLGDKFTLPRVPGTDREKVEDSDKLKVPADYRMIKTYLDYGLDRDPKEEFKHDPLTPVLEWLGSLKKGEYGWYQVIVQDASKYDGKTFPKTYKCEETHEEFTLKDLAEERRKQIRSKEVKPKYKKGDKIFDDYGYPVMIKVSDGVDSEGKPKMKEIQKEYQVDDKAKLDPVKENEISEEAKEELKVITRKLSKPLLRGGIRLSYIAKKENANTGPNIQSLLSVLKQYTGPGFNGFAPSVSEPYDYEWQNTKGKRVPWRAEEAFEAAVERELFYPHIPDRADAETAIGKFFGLDGVDGVADLLLFKYSLGTRKVIRMIYEGFFDPFGHYQSDKISTFNLEEIASLWHLPGQVATTPGIKRIDSLTSDAPSDLPR